MQFKGVLIFNEDTEERKMLSHLLGAHGMTVFETSRVLEAVHILKTNDIGVVIAPQSLNGVEAPEFKELIEKSRPGVNVLFIGACADKGIAVGKEEFCDFLRRSMNMETELRSEAEGLKQFFFAFAERLIQIFEVNNRYFFNNDHMVAGLSRKIAQKMGLDADMADAVRMAALLRDIGKVGIQQQLLEEKKRLTPQELIPIKNHPINTVQILKQIKFPWNVDSIIAQHHEHYDGGGYPLGLKGRQISLGARIIGIADSFYAMTTDRPYRMAVSRDEAVKEILKKAGSQFDPEVVEVFLGVIREDVPEPGAKRSILILERQPNISALIRLSIDAKEADITHAANSFDALRHARQKSPDLVVADVEILDRDAFLQFYTVTQEIASIRNKPFIFIVPDKDYPMNFKGRRLEYVIKPLNITELTAKIASMLEDKPEAAAGPPHEEAKGVTGTLKDFSLTDIVQILNLGLKTAKVEIVNGSRRGIVYLFHGRVVHADAGEFKGNSAFFDMAGWESGTFQILHGQRPFEENITMDTMHLLLEASRIIDEAKEGRGG
ncbi:MAG: DUF4388 domain-containing protein [Thermodesulfovibrionales bacterium]|nr:DUF4388 domain-containing protein [Thermodesulfovibrionales bacterium]